MSTRQFNGTLTVGVAAALGGMNFALAQPASQGAWDTQMEWNLRAVHAIVLRNGTVLALDEIGTYTYDTLLFDPVTNGVNTSIPQQADTAGVDVFCSGHAQLADGRLLFVGGGESAPGTDELYLYDPSLPNQAWSQRYLSLDDLASPRWYPTCTTLGNGKILIAGGRAVDCDWPNPNDAQNRLLTFDITKDPGERYSEPEAGSAPVHDFVWYPYNFLRPNGQVLYTGGNEHPGGCNGNTQPKLAYSFNPNSGGWSTIAPYPLYSCSAATYKPDAFIKIGVARSGGDGSASECSGVEGRTAWKLDLTASLLPEWVAMPCLNLARDNAQIVVLPDGAAMAFSGATEGSTEDRKRPEHIRPDDSSPS